MRYALVSNADSRRQAEAYLPSNYTVVYEGKDVHLGGSRDRPFFVIAGEDDAGWTLDGYVIPRYGSGMIGCREIDATHPIVVKLNLTEVDFTVKDEGTIVLLSPKNDAARMWIDEHLYGDGGAPVQWFGGAVAIDHGMAQTILEGIKNDGLDLRPE